MLHKDVRGSCIEAASAPSPPFMQQPPPRRLGRYQSVISPSLVTTWTCGIGNNSLPPVRRYSCSRATISFLKYQGSTSMLLGRRSRARCSEISSKSVPSVRSPTFSGLRTLGDRKSTRLNSSHLGISYAVFCLKKKKKNNKLNIIYIQ